MNKNSKTSENKFSYNIKRNLRIINEIIPENNFLNNNLIKINTTALNSTNNLNKSENNNTNINFNFNKSRKNITNEENKIIKSAEEISEINFFFKNMNLLTYSGNWYTQNNKILFGNDTNGDMLLKMEKINEKSIDSQTTIYGFKLLKGKYIDEWISYKGISKSFSNIKIKDNQINLSFNSFLEEGEIFEKKNEVTNCSGIFNLTFLKIQKNFNEEINNVNKIPLNEYISEINGTFFSNCGMDIKFELKFDDQSVTYRKVTLYSATLIIFVIYQIMNNLNMAHKIGDSVTLSNSVT